MEAKEYLKKKLMSEDVFTKHQTKIALDTLKMNKTGALIMGGMSQKDAVKHLLKQGYSEDRLRKMLSKNGHSDDEIATEFGC